MSARRTQRKMRQPRHLYFVSMHPLPDATEWPKHSRHYTASLSKITGDVATPSRTITQWVEHDLPLNALSLLDALDGRLRGVKFDRTGEWQYSAIGMRAWVRPRGRRAAALRAVRAKFARVRVAR